MGRAFAAMIKLNAEHTPEFDFGQSNGDGDGEEVDFSDQEALGPCPKCGGRVFEHGMSYVCEKSVGAAKTCDFRSGKVILQQEVARAQMQKLLESGKTDLLKGFVSARTRAQVLGLSWCAVPTARSASNSRCAQPSQRSPSRPPCKKARLLLPPGLPVRLPQSLHWLNQRRKNALPRNSPASFMHCDCLPQLID